MTRTETTSPAQIERVGDTATVRFVRTYDRPPEVVWAALTEPAQLAQWLDETTVDLRVGGRFVVNFSDGTMNGRITELEPKRVLAYSWHEGQYGESHVRWELAEGEGGGTSLTMTHVRLGLDSVAGFAAGWHHHLERMDGVLSGGSTEWQPGRFDELQANYRDVVRNLDR